MVTSTRPAFHASTPIELRPPDPGAQPFAGTDDSGEASAPKGFRNHTVSVVIPALNEARSIGWVVGRIPSFVNEVVLVDGLSTDGTVEAARRARADIVVVREDRRGKGAALRRGFAAATGELIAMLDGDGSMEPGELERFLTALLDGPYDLVKGSRRLPGGGSTDLTPVRRLGNRALTATFNSLYACSFSELCYGYMAFRRSRLPNLRLTADGFEIETQIVVNAVRAELAVGEVASIESPRLHGQSNLHPIRDGIRVLRALVEGRPRQTTAGGAEPRAHPPSMSDRAVLTAAGVLRRAAEACEAWAGMGALHPDRTPSVAGRR